MEITISKMVLSDLPSVRKIAKDVWYETYKDTLSERHLKKHELQFTISSFVKTNREDVFNWYVISINNTSVGYFIYQHFGEFIFLGELYIQNEYQHQGIGKIVISYLKEKFPDKILLLEVTHDNERAFEFYKKCGFKFHETRLNTDNCDSVMVKVMYYPRNL
jgi:ribosomal protein S18 acetylase RimI-like enzyme